MGKIKIGVVGASGRMGQEIAKVCSGYAKATCEVGIINKNAAPGFKKQKKLKEVFKKEVDVIIDFSSPDIFLKTVEKCIDQKIPLVSGTTGLNKEHFLILEKASKIIPVLWAPNMSIGIAVLKKALSAFSNLEGFDFQIEEFHHKMKKDNPSGTAILLQQELKKQVGVKVPEPLGIRGGGIFGIHKVYAMSDDEVITLEHTALNRKVFATGSVQAAIWLSKQKKGLYQILDVIEKK